MTACASIPIAADAFSLVAQPVDQAAARAQRRRRRASRRPSASPWSSATASACARSSAAAPSCSPARWPRLRRSRCCAAIPGASSSRCDRSPRVPRRRQRDDAADRDGAGSRTGAFSPICSRRSFRSASRSMSEEFARAAAAAGRAWRTRARRVRGAGLHRRRRAGSGRRPDRRPGARAAVDFRSGRGDRPPPVRPCSFCRSAWRCSASCSARAWSIRTLRPLQTLTRSMEELGRGVFHPLPVSRGDEIGQLVDSFNRMAAEIEDKRKLESEMAANEKVLALGRIAAGVAHEVNNPLAGMLNCLSTLRAERNDPALVARYLPLIENGLRKIEALVKDLLIELRVEDAHEVADASCLDDVRDLVAAEIDPRRIGFTWDNRLAAGDTRQRTEDAADPAQPPAQRHPGDAERRPTVLPPVERQRPASSSRSRTPDTASPPADRRAHLRSVLHQPPDRDRPRAVDRSSPGPIHARHRRCRQRARARGPSSAFEFRGSNSVSRNRPDDRQSDPDRRGRRADAGVARGPLPARRLHRRRRRHARRGPAAAGDRTATKPRAHRRAPAGRQRGGDLRVVPIDACRACPSSS